MHRHCHVALFFSVASHLFITRTNDHRVTMSGLERGKTLESAPDYGTHWYSPQNLPGVQDSMAEMHHQTWIPGTQAQTAMDQHNMTYQMQLQQQPQQQLQQPHQRLQQQPARPMQMPGQRFRHPAQMPVQLSAQAQAQALAQAQVHNQAHAQAHAQALAQAQAQAFAQAQVHNQVHAQAHGQALAQAWNAMGTTRGGRHKPSKVPPKGSSAQARHSSVNGIRPTKRESPVALVNKKHPRREKASTHPPVSIFEKTLEQIFMGEDNAELDLPGSISEPRHDPVSPTVQTSQPPPPSPGPQAVSSISLQMGSSPAAAFPGPPPPTDAQHAPLTPAVPTHKTLPPEAIYTPALIPLISREPDQREFWLRSPPPEHKNPPPPCMDHLPPYMAETFMKQEQKEQPRNPNPDPPPPARNGGAWGSSSTDSEMAARGWHEKGEVLLSP